MEALPISDADSIISLHYTAPKASVVPAGSSSSRIFDLEVLDDEHLDYKLKISVSQTSRISISYDASKLDEIQAGKFMQLVKFYLDDPDMMLL
jgi:pyruvate/2-oxoglutarate dehydrogenase complex dihydrolipoamide acyltransferase (E2) component